jgi:hypothetical protein
MMNNLAEIVQPGWSAEKCQTGVKKWELVDDLETNAIEEAFVAPWADAWALGRLGSHNTIRRNEISGRCMLSSTLISLSKLISFSSL